MYTQNFTIRWADLDANIHMRHSAYNDYAAHTRLLFMTEHGFGMDWFRKNNVFPVLFREETIFHKEVHGNEKITVDAVLVKMKDDGSRWTITNRFYKENGILAATLVVDGAWMDLVTRKLKVPPPELLDLFNSLGRLEV